MKRFLISVFRIVSSVGEHILSLISTAHYTNTCFPQDDAVEKFLEVQISEVFYYLPYSLWFVIPGKFTNIAATFCWNFMDLFVMMVSIGLSSRFKQINEDLQRVKGQVNSIILYQLKLQLINIC